MKDCGWRGTVGLVLGVAFGSGCAATQAPPEDTSERFVEGETAQTSRPLDDDGEAESEQAPPGTTEDPEFEYGMSVLEAKNAVPANLERLNVEQERLAEPLMDPGTYDPCQLKQQNHFKVTVAVWDGKAVGVDLVTTPKNEELAKCLEEQIRALKWPDKVKSLNTVEYSF